MHTLNLYPPTRLEISAEDATPPAARREHLSNEQCIARYPRITRALIYAGYTITEAAGAIRLYRAGYLHGSEAINATGGTRRALRRATAAHQRHIAARYIDPNGHTARQIARYQAEHRTERRQP